MLSVEITPVAMPFGESFSGMLATGFSSGVMPTKPLVVFTPQAYVVPEAALSVVKCEAE